MVMISAWATAAETWSVCSLSSREVAVSPSWAKLVNSRPLSWATRWAKLNVPSSSPYPEEMLSPRAT